jgi:hypothetical protein
MENLKMKALLILLGVVLAVFVTPVQAQQSPKPKPVIFNGMIFDPPPSQGAASSATRVKSSRQTRRSRVRSST